MEKQVGKYRLVEKLSEGVFGSVYLGVDPDGNRVAIKTIHRSVQEGTLDERAAALLFRESQLLDALEGVSSVPRLVGLETSEGHVYVVAEYVEDATQLDRWLADATPLMVLDLFADLAESLERIHEVGVVHRDLKPSNVLVKDGRAKILDFGVARFAGRKDLLTAPEDTVVGTINYMAPEVWRGDAGDEYVDVFAFGVMLAEALLGRNPWYAGRDLKARLSLVERGLLGDTLERLQRAASEEFGEVAGRRLTHLIQSAVSAEPRQRPTARQLKVELRQLQLPLEAPGEGPAVASTEGSLGWFALLKKRVFAMDTVRSPVHGCSSVAWCLWLAALFYLLWRLLGPGEDESGRLVAAVLLGLALFALAALLRGRESSHFRRALEDRSLSRRVAAMESRLETMSDISQTMVAELEGIRGSVEAAHHDLSASLLAVLSEVGTSSDTSEVDRLLSGLRELASREKRPPLMRRASTWVGIFGGLVTAGGGLVALATNSNFWVPNGVPVVVSIGPADLRWIQGRELLVDVVAEDPDGDLLTFEYEASHGELSAVGSQLTWRSSASSADSEVLEIVVTVRDEKDSTSRSRSIRANRPPIGSLDVPEAMRVGDVVRFASLVSDADGDTLSHLWQVSCGLLRRADEKSVFFVAPEDPCKLDVSCRISDGFEEVELLAASEVVRDR